MATKAKKKYLADKINALITTAPTNFDSDNDAEDTKAKVVDRYDESDDSDINLQVSHIRKQNVVPLDQVDKRYTGKKVSRKDMYNVDSSFGSSSSLGSDEDETTNSMDKISNSDMSDANDEDDDSENDIGDEDDDNENDIEDEDDGNENGIEDEDDDDKTDLKEFSEEHESEASDENCNIGSYSHTEGKKDFQFKTMTHGNTRADIDKGNCVRGQLKLWESLLEVRIKLQKCLVTSNQMPQYDDYKNLKVNVEFIKKTDEAKTKLKLLLNSMLSLQTFLLKQYPETRSLTMQNKKRKAVDSIDKEMADTGDPMDEEIASDTEDENENALVLDEDVKEHNKDILSKKLKLDDYEKILHEHNKFYTDYRNSVIQKWNEKTRLATGKLNKGMNQTTLKQIEFALSDKQKLCKRTQLKRSEYKIIGKTEVIEDEHEGRRVQEYDCEIYDDDDFYHQLLRDLIEYKSSNITDPIQLSKQWIQLQNMRSKMKRKIDTRATKGRRIRYNVHNKLVNFMAPITINDTWTDHAKDELYGSLFGKIKSANVEIGN